MKPNNYILIYDDNCPLCAAYTNWFVKCGMLTKEGRKSFSTINNELLEKTDINRSKNEIPLLNTKTGQVLYGIDALLELLQNKIPFIKSIGNIQPLYWLLKQLYKFISYNRKVIVAKKCSNGQYDCSPDFNIKWRLFFLALFLLLNTLALFPVTKYVFANSLFYHTNTLYVQLLHTGLVGINIALAITMHRSKAIEYLGQINMLATITVLLLLLLATINKLGYSNFWFNNIAILIISLLVFKEYIRRMNYAGTFKTLYITGINALSITGMLLLFYIK